ncbi:metabotropic glutamate receptor 2-like [Oppia nitens]|uniref:metabotropic glutamate receptor 2-like n=1 Tax=Oppia nitens TaxID=1686743 RepID=UPI0023DA07A8|nr:metabotropic glutamate receptor 2-like [Oppia nitens]
MHKILTSICVLLLCVSIIIAQQHHHQQQHHYKNHHLIHELNDPNEHNIRPGNDLIVGDESAVDDEEDSNQRKKRFYTDKQQSPEFLYLESRDGLVLGASLNVHHSSPRNPLQCGQIDTMHGVQHVEAFLWAYDMIQSHPQILPGVELGAVILDTCSSHQKIARDVSNFFSNSLASEEHPNLPAAETVVGFVVDGDNSKIVDAVVDVTNPFDITTVAIQSRDSKYNNRFDYPLLLRLSTPNDVYADTIISLLVRFLWHYVSVIYESTPQMLDIYRELKIKSNFLGIEFSLEEEIGLSSDGYGATGHLGSTISRIKRNAKNGAKVVILLMNNDQIRRLFHENKNLPSDQQIRVGDIQWISIEGREVFPDYTDESLGVLTITSQIQPSTAFRSYFTNLSLINNTRNPWFNEFWEILFNCRGDQCLNHGVSQQMPPDIAIDRDTSLTINSLFALANALEMTRRTLCPKTPRGLCPEFRRHPKLSRIVYDMAKSSTFLAFDNRHMIFDPENGYVISPLFIHNLRLMSQKSLVWHNVGVFTAHDGLFINVTKARAYNTSANEIPLSQVKSVCNDSECLHIVSESNAVQPIMSITPIGGLTIGAIMPLHKHGSSGDLFNCGPIDNDMFENLLAFSYAMDVINKNHSILPNIELGAVVFDDCENRERAQERLITFMSGSLPMNKIPPKTLVSMITYSESAQNVDNILRDNKIIHLMASSSLVQTSLSPTTSTITPIGQRQERKLNLGGASPAKRLEIQALIKLISDHNWSLVNLIYSDELSKNLFVIYANKLKVCVDFMFAISEDMTADDVRKVMTTISAKSESKVVVVLGNNTNVNTVLIKNAPGSLIKNFIWIGGHSWMQSMNKTRISNNNTNSNNTSISTRLPMNSIWLQMESYSDPQFAKYLSRISPTEQQLIPMNWLHQYWQQRFGCHLPHSPVTDNRYEHMCTGDEHIIYKDFIHSPHIQRTIALVNGIANGLKRFLTEKCSKNIHLMETIDDCPDTSRQILSEYVMSELKSLNVFDNIDKQNDIHFGDNSYTFHVWKRINGSKPILLVDLTPDSLNSISSSASLTSSNIKNDFPNVRAKCVRNCDKCVEQFETSSEQLLTSENQWRPQMVVQLRRTWSLLVAVLSALGVISVLICVVYFLLVFPVAVGTTVVGYQILFGLFIAFLTNFVFLIPVSITVCALRRIGLSISYTIIISGLLVKVLNTWRLMILKNHSQPLRLSSPTALVFISSGLVFLQLILTTIWLISYPPHPGLYEGIWKCSSNKSIVLFDSEIIVSLLYVIQLLLISIFFAALTWKCYDQNREPRWIMACVLSTAVIWLTWLLLSAGTSDRTLSIICANLVNALVIMSLLYVRKLYLFTKISRKIRKERQIKERLQHEPFADRQQQIYGAFKTGTISGHIDWMSEVDGSQLRSATRPPFDRDYNDDNISSCGSVKSAASAQVQCHDLYPMEVYDGGSQFAPMSSLLSQSNKSIYGIIDDTNTTTHFK